MPDPTEALRLTLRKQQRGLVALYSQELHPTASSILDKGAKVIVSGGGGALTMRAVAKEADIKLASLQYHFKTFDQFVETLFAREFGHVAESVWQTLERLEAKKLLPIEALRRAAESYMPPENTSGQVEHRIYFHLIAFCSYNSAAHAKAESFYRFYNTVFAYLVSRVNPALTVAECRARAILITSTLEGTALYTTLRVCGPQGDRICHRDIGDMVVHYATRPASRQNSNTQPVS